MISTLPTGHYRVNLIGVPCPPLDALEVEFGPGLVSEIFDGRPWEIDESRKDTERVLGDAVFFLKEFDHCWTRKEAIAFIRDASSSVAVNGYRFATHDEEYAFQKVHSLPFGFVALGDSAVYGGRPCVAGVWRSIDYKRIFSDRPRDSRYCQLDRCLLVSK